MRVIELWRYPVKSIGGERLEAAAIGPRGIVGDRAWGIADAATGMILTARREPQLLFAGARVTDAGVEIRTADGAVLATDEDLSTWLGRAVQLQRASDDARGTFETPLDFEHEDASQWVAWQGPAGSFHDSKRTQVSLVSTETVGRWDVRRFRPNVVVDGSGEDELVGRAVQVGEAALDVVKAVDRCVMVTRPQPGGIERDVSILRTILAERAGNLAVGAIVRTPGAVRVGDAVTPLG